METYRTRVSGGSCYVCGTPLLAGQQIGSWMDRNRHVRYAHAGCASEESRRG